jgi:predicted MFS family arabinose efflux permease
LLALVNCLYIWNASIVLLVVESLLYGWATGFVGAQRVTVATDILGVERVSAAVGLLMLSTGLALPVASVMRGFFKDLSGHYMWSLAFTGGMAILAATCTITSYFLEGRHLHPALEVIVSTEVMADSSC